MLSRAGALEALGVFQLKWDGFRAIASTEDDDGACPRTPRAAVWARARRRARGRERERADREVARAGLDDRGPRAIVLGARRCPDALAELRAVLLQEHKGRERQGLAQKDRELAAATGQTAIDGRSP
jgi:hypothetical protein